jgi:hypothetical protein
MNGVKQMSHTTKSIYGMHDQKIHRSENGGSLTKVAPFWEQFTRT